MPRRAVPVRHLTVFRCPLAVRHLLAVLAVLLVATPGRSLASEPAPSRPADSRNAVTESNIHTTATACGKGAGVGARQSDRCVEVIASGFLGGEPVEVRELRRPGWQLTVRADGAGRVRYRLAASAARLPKPDVLTFVGLGASPVPAGTSGTVQVSVPRIAVYRFGGVPTGR